MKKRPERGGVNWARFAEAVSRWIRDRGLSGKQAAIIAGVAPAIITRAKNGHPIGRDNFMALCRPLQRSPVDFLEGSLFARPLGPVRETPSLEALAAHFRGTLRLPAELADAMIVLIRHYKSLQKPKRDRSLFPSRRE